MALRPVPAMRAFGIETALDPFAYARSLPSEISYQGSVIKTHCRGKPPSQSRRLTAGGRQEALTSVLRGSGAAAEDG